MRILYNNELKNATLTVSSENSLYTFSASLADDRLAHIAQTIGTSGQWIVFTFDSTIDADYFVILKNNITASATVTIQANDSDSWDTPALSENLTLYSDVWVKKFDATQSYQYWRIYIDDPTNSNDYLEISKMYLGDYLEIEKVDPEIDLPKESNSIVSESEGMQVYGSIKRQYIEARFSFPLIEHSSKLLIDSFFETCDKVVPFICLVWEDDLTTQSPFYGRLLKNLNWKKKKTQNTILYWTLDMEIRQVF